MESFPPELPAGFEPARFDGAAALRPQPVPQDRPEDQLARQWAALHRAAAAVAALAGQDFPPLTAHQRELPQRIAAAADWRGGMGRQGVADLAAVMEPGLTALIAVHKRGADPAPAAQALLKEFADARDALLALMGD